MVFNSLTYLWLLISVVVLYWVFPYRARLLLIFTASLAFYGYWRIDFIPVLLTSVAIDYLVAIRMPGSTQRKKKALLGVSLFVNLGLLFYFKYLNFVVQSTFSLASLFTAEMDPFVLNIVLPLGISFYTFQTISYTVDVYRGLIKPEKDFVLYACYVTFFPQLVAGPVLRAAEVICQFAKRSPFSCLDIALGVRRIIYGLFLKVVLADNIAPLVDAGFVIPVDAMSALDVWTLTFLFGFQIYFDFSAYSHIALGSAKLLGIHFPENFNFPYLATSPKDFWRRWHISLSSWIRDYLYLPLAGIRVHDRSVGGLANATVDKKNNAPLFASWMIMGLWHGASWTFLLWGVYHAVIIFFYRLLSPLGRQLNEGVKVFMGLALTLPIMMLGWIPFRAESLDMTFAMWSLVLDPLAYGSLGMRENVYMVAAIVLLGTIATYWVKNRWALSPYRTGYLLILEESIVFAVMISLVIVFLKPINQFIYFQF
jgi:alginate O-acetyltransferase complex protein AlgI